MGRWLAAALLALAGAVAGPAAAQNAFDAAITVNNAVITNYDIEQRVLLLDALGAPDVNRRQLAVQQLTEDRVKVQAAENLGIELPEGAIEAGVEEFATSRGLTVENVFAVLDDRGIDAQTMRDFVESGLVWREVIAGRFRQRATPSEEDLDAALARQATTPQEVFTLAEIALPFAERGEAETAAFADELYRELRRGADFASLAQSYSRSETAATGGVLPSMPATRLPTGIRTQVLLLSPGQVTRPVPISGGLAILKLVSIRTERPAPADAEDPEVRNALREQLFSERITAFGQGYLQELLADAMIVER